MTLSKRNLLVIIENCDTLEVIAIDLFLLFNKFTHTHTQTEALSLYSVCPCLAGDILIKSLLVSFGDKLSYFKALKKLSSFSYVQVSFITRSTRILIVKEFLLECWVKLCTADVRLLGLGCMPLIPFILPRTHGPGGRELQEFLWCLFFFFYFFFWCVL